MMKEIELHLVDAAAPSGEIAIKDLAALATALQELTTRISRDPINTWSHKTVYGRALATGQRPRARHRRRDRPN